MSYKYFARRGAGSAGITINSAAVACFYSNPMQEEFVFIELINGSKLELKTTLTEVEKWLEGSW